SKLCKIGSPGRRADLARPRCCSLQIGVGGCCVSRLRVVVREALEVVVEDARVELLENHGDARVEVSAPGRGQRRQRRFLQEPMPKAADELRVAALLAHDLGAEQVGELVRRSIAGDAFQGGYGEVAANHRGELRESARRLWQTVYASHQQILQRR